MHSVCYSVVDLLMSQTPLHHWMGKQISSLLTNKTSFRVPRRNFSLSLQSQIPGLHWRCHFMGKVLLTLVAQGKNSSVYAFKKLREITLTVV